MKNELKNYITKRIEEVNNELLLIYRIRETANDETRGIMNTRIQYLEQHLCDLKEIQRICVARNRY